MPKKNTSLYRCAVTITMIAALVTPFASALARNAAFPILVACTLILSLPVLRQSKALPKSSLRSRMSGAVLPYWSSPTCLLFVAFLVFALTSILWAPDRERAVEALLQFTFAVLATLYCGSIVRRGVHKTDWLSWAVPISLVVTSLLILSEIRSGSPIRSALGGTTETYRLNRAAVMIVLFSPLLYLVSFKKCRIALSLFAFGFVWVAVFSSISESAKIALLLGSSVFCTGLFVGTRALAALVGGGVVLTHLLAPAIVIALQTYMPPEKWNAIAAFIPAHPGQYIRIEIFAAFAQQVFEAPLFGHGLQSSLSAPQLYEGSDPSILFALSFGHPHNFSLQVWYELGLFGAMLTTAIFALLLRPLLRLPNREQLVATTVLAGAWCVSYLSHGAWQHWWWALLGLIYLFFIGLSKREFDLSETPTLIGQLDAQ